MKITFNAAGYMKNHLPEEIYTMELKDGATLADFYDKLGETKGATLSKAVWAKEKSRFRGATIININGKVIKEEAYPLAEGQHITVNKFIIGG